MLRTFTCIMCPQGCEITAEGSEAPYSITGNISLVMVCSCNVRYLSGPQNMPSRGVSHKGRILFFNMAHSLENCTKNTNIYTNI